MSLRLIVFLRGNKKPTKSKFLVKSLVVIIEVPARPMVSRAGNRKIIDRYREPIKAPISVNVSPLNMGFVFKNCGNCLMLSNSYNKALDTHDTSDDQYTCNGLS